MERHAEGYEEKERCFGEGSGVKERANQNVLVLQWYVDNSQGNCLLQRGEIHLEIEFWS